MKAFKQLSATLFLLFLARITMAQDVIVKNDQTTVMSKVIEITSTEIKYKKWNNQDGPTYSINRSEVAKINYENGEAETFSEAPKTIQEPQPQQVHNLECSMTSSGSILYLNGRTLSDHEIRKLVDPQNYQLYLKAKSQENIAFGCIIVGGIALAVAGIVYLVEPPDTDIHSSIYKTKVAFAIGGLTLGMTGWILDSGASNKAKSVAETYNQTHSNAYSLNISPSLMRCETPQSQGNYGLGITLNVNF